MPKAKAKPAASLTPSPAHAGDFAELRHDLIRPDPMNPRKLFDDEGLAELAASVAADGLLEPLVVRQLVDEPGAYMLIAGERRWRAIGLAIFAGAWPLDRGVPAMVRQVSETDARRLALVENLQRRDLNAIEEARALLALQDLTGVSAGQIGRDLGFTERWAQQRLSLLKLPEKMQERLDSGALKVEDARLAAGMMPKLPPIKQKELERGAITVADAKRWLDNQPKPLSEAAQLAICELLAKAEAEPLKVRSWSSVVGTKIAAVTERVDRGENGVRVTVKVDDPRGAYAELRSRYLVDDAATVKIEEVETGEHCLEPSYEYLLRQVYPDALNPDVRAKRIAELRIKVCGLQADFELTQSGRYATPWLNVEPVTLTPELAAEIEAKRAARVEREANQAAARERDEQARARQAQAWVDLQATAIRREGEIAALEAADRPAQLVELAQACGFALPWSIDDQDNVRTATGHLLFAAGGYWHGDDRKAQLRLIVAIANAGAGVVAPPKARDPDAPTREAFVAMIAGELLEAEDEVAGEKLHTVASANVAAEAGLAAFLRDEAIEYADAGYDWTEAGANALANGILDEGLGAQVDLEDAITAAAEAQPEGEGEDDGETPPYLRRLAGGGAAPAEAAA